MTDEQWKQFVQLQQAQMQQTNQVLQALARQAAPPPAAAPDPLAEYRKAMSKVEGGEAAMQLIDPAVNAIDQKYQARIDALEKQLREQTAIQRLPGVIEQRLVRRYGDKAKADTAKVTEVVMQLMQDNPQADPTPEHIYAELFPDKAAQLQYETVQALKAAQAAEAKKASAATPGTPQGGPPAFTAGAGADAGGVDGGGEAQDYTQDEIAELALAQIEGAAHTNGAAALAGV